MKPFNVEFFNQNFVVQHHTNVNFASYAEDYLKPQKNKFDIPYSEDVKVNQYVRIVRGNEDHFGIVTSVQDGTNHKGVSSITFEQFLSIFDTDIMFDTTLQGMAYLEDVIAQYITDYFIENDDSEQNIYGLSVIVDTQTEWDLLIEPDIKPKEDDPPEALIPYAVINLLNDLIIPAFEKYLVRIKTTVNEELESIMLNIGIEDTESMIEADLPNVLEKKITLAQTTMSTNKLVIYDKADLVTHIDYYLHPDYSYDTTDDDRIVPVVYEIETAEAKEASGEEPAITFAEAAQAKADDKFGGIEFNNLIELTVLNDDSMIQPYNMNVGHHVSVLSNGQIYHSILSAKTIKETTKLTFGLIRLDLTDKIQRRVWNGR